MYFSELYHAPLPFAMKKHGGPKAAVQALWNYFAVSFTVLEAAEFAQVFSATATT